MLLLFFSGEIKKNLVFAQFSREIEKKSNLVKCVFFSKLHQESLSISIFYLSHDLSRVNVFTLLKIIRPLLEGWPFKFVHILGFLGIRHSVETVPLHVSLQAMFNLANL